MTPLDYAREIHAVESPSVERTAEIVARAMEAAKLPVAKDLLDSLQQALLQLQYLDEKHPHGTTAAIIGRTQIVLERVPHGCHLDLDPGQTPDGCVIDDKMPELCTYARQHATKWECKYRRPVLSTEPAP